MTHLANDAAATSRKQWIPDSNSTGPHEQREGEPSQRIIHVFPNPKTRTSDEVLVSLSDKSVKEVAPTYLKRGLRLNPASVLLWRVPLEHNLFPTENSTAPYEIPEEVVEEIRQLFAMGKEEFFEDGMESAFSRNLLDLIEQYGDIAIEIIADLTIGEQVDTEVASEALRWIGQIENPLTHPLRRWLLERSLNSSSASVRDGAVLGLSFMDDPAAIPSIKRALKQEKHPHLRLRMEKTLAQLTNTQSENAL